MCIFNPVLCLSALQAALSHSCCLGCHQHLSLSGSGLQSDAHVVWVQESKLVIFFLFFFSKDCEFIKWWTLDAEMVNLVLEWVDSFERVTHFCAFIWFEVKCLYCLLENMESTLKYIVFLGFFAWLYTGMQVLEWNGVPLMGKTYEDVQGLVGQPCNEAEVCVRLWV